MMNHQLRYAIFLLLCFSFLSAAARTGGLSGSVADAAGVPLPGANVLLLRIPDSALVTTGVADGKGDFLLTPIADGTYLVKVSMAGFQPWVSAPVVLSGQVTLPAVHLTEAARQLAAVAVTAQKPFVEVHADKVVVNVENSIVSAGSSVMEVLARSPGVTVDNSDNISLKGKPGVNVMINGKMQPLSASDLANLLKAMPAGTVDKIELISNPSARYDAAGTAGIINIKLKKDSRTGLNGSANATYAQGVFPKVNAGVNLNYRTKNFNLSGSFNQGQRYGFNYLTLDRRFFTHGVPSGGYVQANTYKYDIRSSIANLGVDYNISSKTVIGINAGADVMRFTRTGHNNSDVIDSATGTATAHFATVNTSPNRFNNFNVNANLTHTFDSAGARLTVDVDYAHYPTTASQEFVTSYTGLPLPDFRLYGDLLGLTAIRSVKADFTRPASRGVNMEAGGKVSYVTADNDLRFYVFDNGIPRNDPSRTNHFIYKERVDAAYLDLNYEAAKWTAQVGLRCEHTFATGQERAIDSSFWRNYTQLFPSFAVWRHLNKQNDLGVTLSRRIERPTYEQLNPFRYFLDPTTYKAGYPYLLPARSYAAECTHTFRQKLITTISYTHVTDPLTEVIQPSPTEARVTIQTTKNLTSMDYYGINGSYRIDVAKWWVNTSNFNAYYARYTGNIAGTSLSDGKPTFDVNITNSFTLPHSWSAELGGMYQAPQLYGYMHLLPSWMVNAGIQKQLWNKRATVRLNATDIFWHGYPRATSYYNDYVESFVAKRDTRQVAASFTWRFGQRSQQPAQRHRGGAEEEKRRAGGQVG